MQLTRGLEADPPRRAGHQRHLPVQVEDGHGAAGYPPGDAASTLRCSLESPWLVPGFVPSTRSSPSPSSRSGCWRAGASATSSPARSPTAPTPRSGASTRARRPPTAAPAPTTSSPASSDVYPRYRTMCGYRVPRKAGWDCHGLPVELEVEKQLGISSKQEIEEFGIAEFNQRCRESVFEYVEEWNRLTERIGFWIDLDDPYVTLEDDYIESVWWSLRKLWDDDRLYEGHKVVPYCPRCGTALSSHEVAQGYEDVKDPSIYVRFPLLARTAEGESLLVWTTTPWTLPGNEPSRSRPMSPTSGRGSAARPDPGRAAGREGAGRGGRDRRRASPAPSWSVVTTKARSSSSTTASRATSPSSPGTSSPPRTGPASSTSRRPSAKTTTRSRPPAASSTRPTHGSLYNPVGPRRQVRRRVAGFEGKFVKDPEVTRGLIADLDRRGLLFREQVYEHAYPHCWRCGTPLLYYASRAGTSAPPGSATNCSPTTRRSAGTPSTSSTAASANGWRTTSTGRSRATAIGAPRGRRLMGQQRVWPSFPHGPSEVEIDDGPRARSCRFRGEWRP